MKFKEIQKKIKDIHKIYEIRTKCNEIPRNVQKFTEIPENSPEIPRIPEFQNSRIPEFKNSRIPKFRNSEIPKFRKSQGESHNSKILEIPAPQNFRNFGLSEFLESFWNFMNFSKNNKSYGIHRIFTKFVKMQRNP